ncbi:replication-relaxation family protein [Emcibacter sp. SYSU 3D8]|uniref:replication-relaxation family protein n=1 Tax=Emcibacter sp. SYSU 3D8 TaxID=3133969 RepID=UPI0031FEA9E1
MASGETHDRLSRRHRNRRTSTGKRIAPTERDLLWFQKIHEHGPLSSTYLHAFTKHAWRSDKRARDRLTDLFNETDTRHGGAYLDRPWQQFRTFDSRYNDLVYSLTDASRAALKGHDLWHDRAERPASPWTHAYMVACITASIELAALADPVLTYIPQHAILERAGADLRSPVAIENPRSGKIEERDLIPDALFGLEYQQGGERRFRFFLVEADRATEPSRTQVFNRKSHLRTFLQYREYVGRQLYKQHLNLSAALLVLNVTTSPRAEENMLRLVGELSPTGNSYLLFRTAEQFGRYFKPPSIMDELATGPWRRAGWDGLRIDQPA